MKHFSNDIVICYHLTAECRASIRTSAAVLSSLVLQTINRRSITTTTISGFTFKTLCIKALTRGGAVSVIVKTNCETNGSIYSTALLHVFLSSFTFHGIEWQEEEEKLCRERGEPSYVAHHFPCNRRSSRGCNCGHCSVLTHRGAW